MNVRSFFLGFLAGSFVMALVHQQEQIVRPRRASNRLATDPARPDLQLHRDSPEAAGDPAWTSPELKGAAVFAFERAGGAPGPSGPGEVLEHPGRPGESLSHEDPSQPIKLANRALNI